MALDKEILVGDINDHVADVATSGDAVNASVSTIGFMCSLFRKYKTDPVAIAALAEAFDDRKTEIAQAVVANTNVGGGPEQEDKALPAPVQTQTEANSGNFGLQKPKADDPSYVPPSAGDAGGAVKDGVTLADKQAADTGQSATKDKPIGKTVEDEPKDVVTV